MIVRNYWMSLCLVFLVLSSFTRAQLQAETVPLKVTMCDLYKDPQKYAGRMIEVRARIVGYRDPDLEQPSFAPREPCSAYMIIALELPQKTKPKPDFDLVRDASFQKYQEALKESMAIEATLEGRFDPVFIWKNRKRVRIGKGKGYGKRVKPFFS